MLHPDLMKKVLVLGDCHIGSKLAVAPENALISQMSPAEPTILQLNKVQKALLKAWDSIVEEWQKPDILVINGEPMEGDKKKKHRF